MIRAALEGDKGSFDALVERYDAGLRAFLGRRLAMPELDDVVQETWLAAWTALPSFDRRSRFKTWLYALSLNKCRDHHRARRRVGPAEALPEDAPDTTNLHKLAEDRETVSLLLDALSPSQREVLELYYFAELSLPEVARALQRNLNTVKYQFYRAHVQASQAMSQEELKQ